MQPATNIITQFSPFIKRSTVKAIDKRDAIIYTRVSSKEQVENNSLEIQQRECLLFARKRELTVVKEFGGTHESAQTDERKEFGQMISYAKRHRIANIIVYSLDRFSRSGDNAIWLTNQLKGVGVSLLSVTQPMDTNNPAGAMMQKMLLLFAQHDNDQRRSKTIGGMQERLRKGYWCGMAPYGYMNVQENGVKFIIPDKKTAPLVKMAFELKTNFRLSDVEIAKKLNAAGYASPHRTEKHLNLIFKNPFYCGLLVHSVIPNEIIEGKHEPLISKETFLKVNDIKEENHQGYKCNLENEFLPLRAFVRCDNCGTGYAGYVVKKKSLYYYKCNRKGCKCNRSAKVMHEQFNTILEGFTVDPRLIEPLKIALLEKIDELTKDNRELSIQYQRQLTEAQKKLDTLSERFALGEIKEDMYEKFSPKYQQEVNSIDRLLRETCIDLSNREKYAEKYIEKAMKAPQIWQSSDYTAKVDIQKFIFPEGISYNHQKAQYRTTRINGVFAFIALYNKELGKKETGLIVSDNEKSGLVAGTGLEPMTFGL